uniref:Uncharacterized protein n=1 Tax=Rhizophora mucronata TaxID=61149 RepID=A0A2P2J431_RHIMU
MKIPVSNWEKYFFFILKKGL